MSEPPRDTSGLQSGDPLGGAGAPVGTPPGYTSPAPPGAGGPLSGGPFAPAPAAFGGRFVLAGWWRRAGAQLIDGLIVGVGALILLLVITAPFSVGFFASDNAGFASLAVGAFLAIVCIAIVALLYAPALMARTNGKTLGRMATGIRVVRASGEPITFGFAMLREVVVKSLLFGIAGSITGGIVNLVDYLWPLWDEENRALHDFVVNTRTVIDE
jgi:uncharacterized RDD family membrane protein YckC